MHNVYPQMGYYHQGLGRYVYNDAPQMGEYPQMGDIFSDIKNALAKGWEGATTSVETQAQLQYKNFLTSIASLPAAAKEAAIRDFLNTQTGQTLVEEAKQTWLQEQYYKYVKPNQNYILIGAVVAVGLGLYLFLRK